MTELPGTEEAAMAGDLDFQVGAKCIFKIYCEKAKPSCSIFFNTEIALIDNYILILKNTVSL